MITVEEFSKRFFKEHQDSAVLVLSESNRFYFTGFESSDGAVLLFPDEYYLIVDFRYYEIAQKEAEGYKVLLSRNPLIEEAAQICKKHGVARVFIEDDYVSLSMFERIKNRLEGFEIQYLGNAVTSARAVKTQKEIDAIAKAQQLTDAAFSNIIGILHCGMTEREVAAELDYYMRRNGADGSAFKTICVSGKKSSLPHGEPGDVLLTPNSFLTMDFGARLDGYCADMTRTVVMGKADEEMKRIYGIVLEAQLNALKKIRANVKGSEVDGAARSIIEREGFGECFGHSTGHGLGIEVHESPSFSPRYNGEIPLNAVLSVEPGIYIEGKYGVRIEDIVVVGQENPINLTQSTKKLLEIE